MKVFDVGVFFRKRKANRRKSKMLVGTFLQKAKHTEHVRFSSWWLQSWMRTGLRLGMQDVCTFYTLL